jgi:hypothetical protein
MLNQIQIFQLSQYGRQKLLMLESVRTETTTSRGYESSYIFIEVVLLFGLWYSLITLDIEII